MIYSAKLDNFADAGKFIERLMFFSDIQIKIRRTTKRVHIDFFISKAASIPDQHVVTEMLGAMESEFEVVITPKSVNARDAWELLEGHIFS